MLSHHYFTTHRPIPIQFNISYSAYCSPYQTYIAKSKMSKAIDAAFTKLKGVKNAASKFSASAAEGNRIMPSPTKDADYQIRIDAGHFDPKTKRLNVALQVNSQAKSPGLVDWVKKNSTHANLATATFDTKAQDQTAELNRVLEVLKQKAKENIK